MLPNHEMLNPAEECVITSARTFHYPCSKFFKAWSQPEHLKVWWGPDGFTNTFHEFNFTEGGWWKFTMHGPDGADYLNECLFLKIEPYKHLVWNHYPSPLFQMNVRFEEEGSNTKLIFRMVFLTKELCEQLKPVCIPKNEENFNRLEAVLQKMQA
jgi:uncharacterized protein YndB with AHSA1/START domain